MSPNGTNIKIARSMKGKNKFIHIRNLDFMFNFFEVITFTFLNASIIPLAHLFLCLNKSLNVFGDSVKAIAFFAKLTLYPFVNKDHVNTISSPTQSCHPFNSFIAFVL